MKKKKDLSQKQQPKQQKAVLPGNPKITVNYHSPKHPVTVTGAIDTRGNKRQNGQAQSDLACMTIRASSKDWNKLWRFYNESPSNFTNRFWADFICPAIIHTQGRKGPRGKNRPGAQFVRWIKTDASELYHFLLFWMGVDSMNWPKYLKTLFTKFKAEGAKTELPDGDYASYFKEATAHEKATALTAYCLQKVHGEAARGILAPFFKSRHIDPGDEDRDRESWIENWDVLRKFYETYCLSERHGIPFIEIEINRIQEGIKVADLAFQPPLDHIFSTLKTQKII